MSEKRYFLLKIIVNYVKMHTSSQNSCIFATCFSFTATFYLLTSLCLFRHYTIPPPLTFLTYLYNKKRRRIPPITIVHPIMEPLSPMQSNSPLIIEKIQYIMYTRNRPRPTPNSSQKNNDIIFYFII